MIEQSHSFDEFISPRREVSTEAVWIRSDLYFASFDSLCADASPANENFLRDETSFGRSKNFLDPIERQLAFCCTNLFPMLAHDPIRFYQQVHFFFERYF